jgi:hypothetical protein
MNSAFKFFTELISLINKQSEKEEREAGESSGGFNARKLKIRIHYVKITT